MRRPHNKFNILLAFVDLLMNLLLAYAFMFSMSLLIQAVERKKVDEQPKHQAEFVLRIVWQPESRDDVDLWMQLPDMHLIGFAARESGYANLERDDLGASSDYKPDGTPVLWNEENIFIRGIVPGKYAAVAHLYSHSSSEWPKVHYELVKLNPKMRVIRQGDVVLEKNKDEKTLVRFTIDAQGEVTESNEDVELILRNSAARSQGYDEGQSGTQR